MISSIIKKMKVLLSKVFNTKQYIENHNIIKLGVGKILTNINSDKNFKKINDYEFKVYSQFGEDGIIQFLINNIKITNKSFIEFGVENYEEANTRFLLENNNWSGLIIDSSSQHISHIKNQNYCVDAYCLISVDSREEMLLRLLALSGFVMFYIKLIVPIISNLHI